MGTKPDQATKARGIATGTGNPKLFEIKGLVEYAVVILADSKEQALSHVESWEKAWSAGADLIGTVDCDLVDIRDGSAEEAHFNISTKPTKTHD